jgi:hypothetical protein
MALMRFVLASAGLAFLTPQEPAVPNVVIDHQPVDCVLAGQPPALAACFTPPEEIVRARVYYRLGEGAWQFTALVPEGTCFGAVLPRPTRTDGSLRYYLEAVDLASQSTRSSEYRAIVVQDKNACAGVLAAVKPGGAQMASGGRKKALPVILIGAGAAGAGVALAGGGGGGGATTLGTSSLPATVSSTIASVSTTPESSSTTTPGSTTTTVPGSTTTIPGSTTTTLPGSTTTTLPGSTTTTTTQPCTYSISPSDSIVFGSSGGSGAFTLTTGASCAWDIDRSDTWITASVTSGTGGRVISYNVQGYVLGTRNAVFSVRQNTLAQHTVHQNGLLPLDRAHGNAQVSSELAVAGGSGQIVWDGASVTYAAEGTGSAGAAMSPGLHRVEALLVSADGTPGTWRFSLAGGAVKGLRPVAGKVDAVAPDALTFRLSGRAGERVVFVFDAEP